MSLASMHRRLSRVENWSGADDPMFPWNVETRQYQRRLLLAYEMARSFGMPVSENDLTRVLATLRRTPRAPFLKDEAVYKLIDLERDCRNSTATRLRNLGQQRQLEHHVTFLRLAFGVAYMKLKLPGLAKLFEGYEDQAHAR